MALSKFVGSFDISATGNVAVTGLGFQPKVVIFFPTARTTTGTAAGCTVSMGASTGSGNNYTGFAYRSRDAQGTSDAGRIWSSSHCIIRTVSSSDAIDGSATMVSLDADGFTVNVDDAPSATRTVGFMALGGTDVESVEVGTFNLSTAAAGNSQDVTLAGAFRPTGLILLSSNQTDNSETWGADAAAVIGFTDGTNQRCFTAWSDDNQGTSVCRRSGFNNRILAGITSGSSDYEFSFSSFLANGFRLAIDDATASAFKVVYIAIKGPQFYVDDYAMKLTAGTITSEQTAVGFQPEAILFASNDRQYYDNTTNAKLVLGVTSATNKNFASALSDDNNEGTTISYSAVDTANCMIEVSTPGGSIISSQVLASFEAAGFTLTENVGSSSANLVGYMAIGATAVSAGSLVGDSVLIGDSPLIGNETSALVL